MELKSDGNSEFYFVFGSSWHLRCDCRGHRTWAHSGGFLVAAVFGVIGAWVGAALFGNFGPALANVSLIPTILGSAILVFIVALVSGYAVRR